MQFGMVAEIRWLWPSACCRPSPLSVVRPAVPPTRKPRAWLSRGGPRKVADTLEAEHRVVDVERDQRDAVVCVRRRRRDPRRHRARLVDALLEDLASSLICSTIRTSSGSVPKKCSRTYAPSRDLYV